MKNNKRGIAIIMVLAILSTLIIVSIPFAIALRSEKRATKVSLLQTQMNIEADGIQDYAIGQLAKNSNVDLKEVTKNLEKNKAWSVHIEDELGKININTVDPFTLGNLIASAIIQKDLGSTDNVIIVDSTNRFPTRGTLWLHGEVISYQNITPTSFIGCSRHLVQSSQVMRQSIYPKGTQIIDIRAYEICKYRIQKNTYVPFANIEEIKKVPGVDDELFTRIKPFLTVYSNSHARWIHKQPVTVQEDLSDSNNTPSFLLSTKYKKKYIIYVEDIRFFKVGMTVRLHHVDTIIDTMILKIYENKTDKNILIVDSEITFNPKDELGTGISLLEAHPVNINNAQPFTLYSLLKGQKIKNTIHKASISSKCASILSSAITGYTQSGRKFANVKDIYEFLKKLKEDLKNAREVDEEGNILLQDESECLAISLLLGGSGNNIPLVCYDTQRVYTIESTALQYKNNIPEASQSVCTITTAAPIAKQQWGLKTYHDFMHNHRILPSQHISILPKEVDILQEILPQDSLSMGISVASTRLFPKNLPQDRMPSYTYRAYDNTEQGIVYPDESPDITFSKDDSQRIRPGTLSFWFYPYTTSDQTIVSLTTDPWENNLVLKYENGAWLLQLSDSTLGHIVSEIKYNATLQQTWYYICIAWYNTKLGGLALWIDNKPVGQSGFQKETTFSSMKLKSALSETDTNISLTSASILPEEGAIQIGSEIIEYDSRSHSSLHVRQKYSGYPKTEMLRRGARGTNAKRHPEGALVSLVGYKTGFMSRDSDSPCLFPASKLKSAIVAKDIYTKHESETPILERDTKIPVKSTANFANKGIIFIAGKYEEESQEKPVFGYEFIYYKNKNANTFLNCTRGFYNSKPHKYTKAYILPFSIYVEDNKDYADPEKQDDCFIQIDDEWIKYEKKEDKDLLVYRTEIENVDIQKVYDMIMNNQIKLSDLYSRYRGICNTPKQDHKDGTLVLPVFRVSSYRVGPYDEVTIINNSEQKESNQIQWSYKDPNTLRQYVALKEDVKNEYKKDDLFLKFPTGDLPKIDITKFQWGNKTNSFIIDELRYMNISNYSLSTKKIINKNDKNIALDRKPQDNQLYKIGDEYFAYIGTNNKNTYVRNLLNSGSQNYSESTNVYDVSFIPITALSNMIDDKLDEIPVYNINDFPPEGYLYCNDEIIGYTGLGYNDKTKGYQFSMPYTQDIATKKHIEGLLRGRYGTMARKHMKNSVIFPFVTRYYDRYMTNFRGPACSYLYMAKTVPGAFWKSIEWIEPEQSSKLGVHVFIFINQHKCLDFHSPAKKYDINVAGDTLEVFVWFPYQDNAYLNGQWKTRTVVKDLKVEYYQTTNVWQKKRYCLQ